MKLTLAVTASRFRLFYIKLFSIKTIIFLQVRFRQGQDLQDLSKGTQSGGEKSVSTAVYMMALQEMTQVPFRCVDEINQGGT